MADNGPWLSAQATGLPGPFKAIDAASRARRNAGLRNRRKVEPVRYAFVAERRSVHSPDERLDPFCNS